MTKYHGPHTSPVINLGANSCFDREVHVEQPADVCVYNPDMVQSSIFVGSPRNAIRYLSERPLVLPFKQALVLQNITYLLVMTDIAIENHHVQWENSLFQLSFSKAILTSPKDT